MACDKKIGKAKKYCLLKEEKTKATAKKAAEKKADETKSTDKKKENTVADLNSVNFRNKDVVTWAKRPKIAREETASTPIASLATLDTKTKIPRLKKRTKNS